jgi:tetratricopeptide (TPR) repeat protein
MIKSLILAIIIIVGFISCGCISSQQPIITTNTSINTLTTAPTIAPVSIQSTPAAVSPTISPELASYQKGLTLYNKGDYLEAIDAFNSTISLNATNGKAYLARGKAFYQLGRMKLYEFRGEEEYNQAISDLSKALHYGLTSNETMELFTLRGYSNYWIGKIQREKYSLKGKYSFYYYEAAATDFTRVLADNPDDVDALIGRSMANNILGKGTNEVKYPSDQNKAELAGKDAQHANELEPDNAWSHWALAENMEMIQNLDLREVKKQLDEAIKDDPDEAWFYGARFLISNNIHEYDDARSDELKTIALQPRSAMAYEFLGLTDWIQNNDKESFMVNTQKGLEINPNIPTWWMAFAMAQLYFMDPVTTKGLEESLSSIDRAIDMDPDNPDFHKWRFDVLIWLNRISEAREEVRIYKNLELADRAQATFIQEVVDNPMYYGNKIMRAY